MRNAFIACKSLIGKPEREKQLGRSKCRGEYHMKTDIKEISWRGGGGVLGLN
jgi:hypothetical protein